MSKKLNTHYFLDKKFVVNEGTYIPHFETEYIVVKVEKYMRKNNYQCVFEVGAGSGCISILLKHRNKDFLVTTIEVDENVYKNTLINIALHKKSINCLNLDLMDIKQICSDVVVSNPPYIKSEEAAIISKGCVNVKRNIDGGSDGLNFAREILKKSFDSRYCILELGYSDCAQTLENEFKNIWKLVECEKPLVNLEVYFCVFMNTRYWT